MTDVNIEQVNTAGADFHAQAEVTHDGRAKINLHSFKLEASKLLSQRLIDSPVWKIPIGEHLTKNNKHSTSEYKHILTKCTRTPKLNIAIFIVGSRGDVQPFIPIAQILTKEPYNHRVRICTHPVFKGFVEENGLEFFSIGGDPATLMAYMVKNPGLMPGLESLKAGDVGKRRADISEILEGCWRACIEPGDGMTPAKRESLEDPKQQFIAEAIIANPPSYAHIHCAEKLGIPLHMIFTMPWSPTQSFPHPLTSFDRHDTDPKLANYISYTMMELLAWQGLGDVINKFRVRTLRLDPISPLWGHMLLSRMKIPFTYAWSSTLIPKPADWGPHINVTGFSFLPQASSYQPAEDLAAFLKAGPPPVYIGFGSIVVDHPEQLTALIYGAVKRAGVRALVSQGWGGLGGDKPPEGVFLLGNVPHDWLFQHVSAVVHHGGAGTTAIGIALGKPTVVVPFFGDQPFWGAMIAKAGAGPEPIPFKKMTEESLAQSIMAALTPEIQAGVKIMAEKIAKENGAAEAVNSFTNSIDMDSMRCLVSPDNVAAWRIKNTDIRLSLVGSATLIDEGYLNMGQLKLVRHRDWYIDEGATDPITGMVAFGSGIATTSLSLIFEYEKSLATTIKKKKTMPVADGKAKDPSLSSSDAPLDPEQTYSPSWDIPAQQNPVQQALTYPPERLELFAAKLASKTYDYQALGNQNRWIPRRTKSGLHMVKQKKELDKEHGLAYETAHETGDFGKGVIATGLRTPVALFYNLANGFHNAPSFWLGDETVRRRDKITGIGSGVRTAGKEFTFGLYDGFTGVVIHPYMGARKDGVVGFATGVGKGLGGLVFKTCAAGLSIPAYTLKGVEKQFEKRHNRPLVAQLLAIRIRQSLASFEHVTQREKDDVIARWKEQGFDKGTFKGVKYVISVDL